MTLEALNSLLCDLFPARGGTSTLELADLPAVQREPAGPKEIEDSLRLTVRLVSWDRPDGSEERQITDIKEQSLYLGPVSLLQRGERLMAFFHGSHAVLQQLFDSGLNTDTLLPHELLRPAVLKLVKAQTADDFRRALLTKKRLGGWLPRS